MLIRRAIRRGVGISLRSPPKGAKNGISFNTFPGEFLLLLWSKTSKFLKDFPLNLPFHFDAVKGFFFILKPHHENSDT